MAILACGEDPPNFKMTYRNSPSPTVATANKYNQKFNAITAALLSGTTSKITAENILGALHTVYSRLAAFLRLLERRNCLFVAETVHLPQRIAVRFVSCLFANFDRPWRRIAYSEKNRPALRSQRQWFAVANRKVILGERAELC
jgi:hypothetical protein